MSLAFASLLPSHLAADPRRWPGDRPYTFTAKRYTFTYTRIVAMLTRMIERGNQVREEGIVYGYVNENGNEEDSGRQESAGDWQ